MKIKERTSSWGFADFSAIMVCEHCGRETHLQTGYDDSFYHTQVIPAMRCKECGKNREDVSDKKYTDLGVGIQEV